MTNCERYITISMPAELFQLFEKAAKEAMESNSRFGRKIIAEKLGFVLQENSFCHPRDMRRKIKLSPPLPFPPKKIAVPSIPAPIRKGTPEAEYRVLDYKKRGFSKPAVAAMTKLPYAEVKRLWEKA